MRAPLALAAGAILLAMTVAGSAGATWYETRITQSPDAATRPIVTYDDDNILHVIWEEAGEIRHVAHTEEGWTDVDVVGTGFGVSHYTCLS